MKVSFKLLFESPLSFTKQMKKKKLTLLVSLRNTTILIIKQEKSWKRWNFISQYLCHEILLHLDIQHKDNKKSKWRNRSNNFFLFHIYLWWIVLSKMDDYDINSGSTCISHDWFLPKSSLINMVGKSNHIYKFVNQKSSQIMSADMNLQSLPSNADLFAFECFLRN